MTAATRGITLAAGLFGFLGVALGAFGAHALKGVLEAGGHVDTWKTAVLYQLVHAVALLALAGWRDAQGGPGKKVAWCWSAGIVLFSGSLYGLSLGGPRILGPITPLGGGAFLLGWVLLIWRAWKQPAA
jgi:uncharacterized membrane protein YgdD (TMEM256/DUF423 family)